MSSEQLKLLKFYDIFYPAATNPNDLLSTSYPLPISFK